MPQSAKSKLKMIAFVPWITILFAAAILKPIQMHAQRNVPVFMNSNRENALNKTYYTYLFILIMVILCFIHKAE